MANKSGVFIGLTKKVYRLKSVFSIEKWKYWLVWLRIHYPKKFRKQRVSLEIGDLVVFELKLKLVGDEGDEFTIGRLALGITDCISKKALEGVQIASVPSHFDGVADGSLNAGGCGLEGFGDLRVEHLGDGISLAYGQQKGSEWVNAF